MPLETLMKCQVALEKLDLSRVITISCIQYYLVYLSIIKVTLHYLIIMV